MGPLASFLPSPSFVSFLSVPETVYGFLSGVTGRGCSELTRSGPGVTRRSSSGCPRDCLVCLLRGGEAASASQATIEPPRPGARERWKPTGGRQKPRAGSRESHTCSTTLAAKNGTRHAAFSRVCSPRSGTPRPALSTRNRQGRFDARVTDPSSHRKTSARHSARRRWTPGHHEVGAGGRSEEGVSWTVMMCGTG